MSDQPIVLDALTVKVGTKLRLRDGSIVEVTENPMDGIWLFCRYLSSADESHIGLEDQPIYSDEVVAIAE